MKRIEPGGGAVPSSADGPAPVVPDALTALMVRARDLAIVHAAMAVGADEAEEIGQRVTLTLWRRWVQDPQGFQSPDPLEHWVSAAVRRGVIELKRRWLRAAPRHETYEALRNPTREFGMAPDATMNVREVERQVAEILNDMSPKQREAFFLARDQELSYREIAARSGGSERTVNTHVTRAMSALRRGLEGYADPAMLKPRVGRPGGRRQAEGATND